jgi:hypothetical protein
MDDAPCHRERELDHLAFGLVDHLGPERGQFLERLGQAPQHGVAALGGGLGAGTLPLREPLGERLALERGQPGLVLGRIELRGRPLLRVCVERFRGRRRRHHLQRSRLPVEIADGRRVSQAAGPM